MRRDGDVEEADLDHHDVVKHRRLLCARECRRLPRITEEVDAGA
jgi:hypothetical protein